MVGRQPIELIKRLGFFMHTWVAIELKKLDYLTYWLIGCLSPLINGSTYMVNWIAQSESTPNGWLTGQPSMFDRSPIKVLQWHVKNFFFGMCDIALAYDST